MPKLHEHLKRISQAMFNEDLDDCEYVSAAYEILRDIYKETDGNPSIRLMDGLFYKPIPDEIADRIGKEMDLDSIKK